MSEQPFNICISYSHEDEGDMRKLKKHFARLEKNGDVKIWSDAEVDSGSNLWKEINSHFNRADIVLSLLSSDYLESESCVKGELIKMLQKRKKDGSVRIIPVILRPCDWIEFEELGTYKALPYDAVPVSNFESKDEAFLQVVKAISDIVTKGKITEQEKQEIPMDDELSLKILYSILTTEENPRNKGICLIKQTNISYPLLSFCFPYDSSKRKYKPGDSFTETKFDIIVERLIELNWLDEKPYVENTSAHTLKQYKINKSLNYTHYSKEIGMILESKNIDPHFAKILNESEMIDMCREINEKIHNNSDGRYRGIRGSGIHGIRGLY